jgi:hypothetical protein
MAQRYLGLCDVWLGPVKAALLKPFCANPKSAAIPENDLQPIALCVRKQKEVAAQGIAQQLISHQTMQTIKPFAHVCCARRHVYPCGRAHPEHRLQPLKYSYQSRQGIRIETAADLHSATASHHDSQSGKLSSRNSRHRGTQFHRHQAAWLDIFADGSILLLARLLQVTI